MTEIPPPSQPRQGWSERVHRFFHGMGPGVITGAADDDPSGISTYSVAGAAFGFSHLWTVLLSYPLMVAVQTMCARLGLVTGTGLAGAIRRHFSRHILWGACLLLAIANIINIGADLSGMAEALEMVTGVATWTWLPLIAGAILGMLIGFSYRFIVRVFKWLTLVLFAYIAAAFLAHPDWFQALRATFVPRIDWSMSYLTVLVAILGTTISPYMLFWQAAQEVEEERAMGRRTIKARHGATEKELHEANRDVRFGMAWAGLSMYFIILTTGATLHKSGLRDIETAQQAAEALRPLAGDAAYWLFTLGLIGTGMLGVPVLAGSAAYAIAEAMHWRGSFDDRPHVGRKFYGVVAAAVLLGLALDLFQVNAVRALFWAAVINGLLAPPLVVLVTLLTSNPKVMGRAVNPPLLRWLGWMTAIIMTAAAMAMIIAAITGFR